MRYVRDKYLEMKCGKLIELLRHQLGQPQSEVEQRYQEILIETYRMAFDDACYICQEYSDHLRELYSEVDKKILVSVGASSTEMAKWLETNPGWFEMNDLAEQVENGTTEEVSK